MAQRAVPHLSLKAYTEGGPEDKQQFIDQLYEGLKDYGFIVLRDHLVDQSLVDQAYKLFTEFFKLPLESKLRYYDAKIGGQRGYTPFKTEHAKDNPHPDLKEFWHVGRELAPTSPYYNVYPANVWVEEIPQFKDNLNKLYQAMDRTGVVLLEALGKALNVPSHFFRDMVADGNSILRAIHYPPIKGLEVKDSVRAAAHEDINLITLLVGATNSGLELLDRDGTWLKVESGPDEIVVDTGDMMSRLTNNVLPATTHRVVNPDQPGEARYSMPYFVHPHSDASLACLESCVGEGVQYPPITAGEFLMERLREIGLY